MDLSVRKARFFLPAFGDYLPGVPENIPTVLKTFPPYRVTDKGLDLDLIPLLIADGIVMDRGAYAYIKDPSRPYLRPMAQTLEKLEENDRLTLQDFSQHVESFSSELTRWVELQLDEPGRWLPALREQISNQAPMMNEQLDALGVSVDRQVEAIPFGILSYLLLAHGKVDFAEAASLSRLVRARRSRYSEGEKQVIREVVRPYVTQTSLDSLLSQRLDIPFTMWPPDELLYRKLSMPNLVQSLGKRVTKEHLDECRRLFVDVVPSLRPLNVEETLEFLKHRRARVALRHAIQQSVLGVNVLSSGFIERTKEDFLLRNEEAAKLQKILKLVFGVIGFSTGHLILAEAAEITKELIHFLLEAADFSADETIEKHASGRISWYVELLKITRSRKDVNAI